MQQDKHASGTKVFIWGGLAIVGLGAIALVLFFGGGAERKESAISQEEHEPASLIPTPQTEETDSTRREVSAGENFGEIPSNETAETTDQETPDIDPSKPDPVEPELEPSTAPNEKPIDPTNSDKANAADVIRINPFVDLPNEIDLIVPTANRSSLQDSGSNSMKVGDLAGDSLGEIQIAVLDRVASLENRYRFEAKPDSQTEQQPIWNIILAGIPDADDQKSSNLGDTASAVRKTVAVLSLKDRVLSFTWGPDSGHRLAEQLRNCVLTFVAGPFEHAMRLRSVQLASPLVIDLESMPLEVRLAGRALPDTGTWFLDLTSLEKFSGQWRIRPSARRVEGSRELKIVSTSGPRIEFRFRIHDSKDGPSVKVLAYYYRGKTGQKKDRLTKKLLAKRITRVEASIRSSQRKLQQMNNRSSSLSSQISKARSQSATTASARQAKMIALSGLQKRLATSQKSINRLQRSIPEAKASLTQLIAVAKLAGQLHQRAEVKFRVGVEAEEGDFDLLAVE